MKEIDRDREVGRNRQKRGREREKREERRER